MRGAVALSLVAGVWLLPLVCLCQFVPGQVHHGPYLLLLEHPDPDAVATARALGPLPAPGAGLTSQADSMDQSPVLHAAGPAPSGPRPAAGPVRALAAPAAAGALQARPAPPVPPPRAG